MKKVEFRTDKDILYINLDGRIDASNAAEVENSIIEIKKEHPGMHTVLDADGNETDNLLSIIVYKDRVIAGDITNTSEGGTVSGFIL